MQRRGKKCAAETTDAGVSKAEELWFKSKIAEKEERKRRGGHAVDTTGFSLRPSERQMCIDAEEEYWAMIERIERILFFTLKKRRE